MKIQFLSSAMHSVLDYLAAVGLIFLPLILGLTGTAFWLSVAGGVGLILYSLLTDYRFGLIRALSFDQHLILDCAAGIFFIIAPFLFGFDRFSSFYFFVMAAGVIAVVAFSSREVANVGAGVA